MLLQDKMLAETTRDIPRLDRKFQDAPCHVDDSSGQLWNPAEKAQEKDIAGRHSVIEG